jgi:hypothetical protein
MKIPTSLKFASLALFAALAFGATEFHLSDKTKIGTLVLPAGDYSLGIKGSVAVIKDENSGKSFTTVVKSQTGNEKFKGTVVHATTLNGEHQIQTIDVGGSTTTLVFD